MLLIEDVVIVLGFSSDGSQVVKCTQETVVQLPIPVLGEHDVLRGSASLDWGWQ